MLPGNEGVLQVMKEGGFLKNSGILQLIFRQLVKN